jgi:mannose-6-phosphate isomerase-like protein (cupin superfamily)
MRVVPIEAKHSGFTVVARTSRSEAATMVLDRGESTGGPDNRHRDSDQWLWVVEGHGRATVEGQEVTLEPGALLLIEAGEAHRITNTGGAPLRTVNVYGPPAY